MIKMLSINVCHYGYHGREHEKRAIAFVGLGNHEVSLSKMRVCAECSYLTAHNNGRIKTSELQHSRNHRGRSRLSVASRNGYSVFKPHQFRKHLGSRNYRNLTGFCRDHLWIIFLYGRRHYYYIGIPNIFRTMAYKYLRSKALKPLYYF